MTTQTLDRSAPRLVATLRRGASGILQPALAVLAALVFSFVIIALIADNPAEAFRAFTLSSFVDLYSFGTMLSLATILVITGLSSMVAFKAGAFNIGGEGQVYIGGLTSALVALHLPAPGPVTMIVSLLAGAVAGALWILIPAVLRVYYGVTEIVTTLMSTYIATAVTAWLVTEYFQNPTSGARETDVLPSETWLPRLFDQSHANIGLILAVALVVVFAVYYSATRGGVRTKVVGLQPSVAEALGLPQRRILLSSLLTSGALAGLGGALAIMGITHAFMDGFSPQFGFLGITVALIGRLSPFGVLLAALLYGSLMNGATSMQSVSDVPFALVFLLQGVLILLVTARRLQRTGSL